MEIKPLSDHLAVLGRTYILDAIQECGGDRAEAAKRLGISMATLYRKLGSAAPLNEPIGRTEPNSVYLMVNKRAGAHKIGCSNSPGLREATLQAQDPGLELVARWPGTRLDEAILHRRFAEKRIRGEWFDLSAEDLAAVRDYFEKPAA